jgi:CubicO group peptidase (beta-lactamase class C family)
MRAAHYQAVLDRYQAERRLPSIVAGVLEGPELAWSGTAGADTDTDTQYRIGSITKTMTAVLVLQCRDDGLLDLDDPVGRYLPESGYG